MGDGLIDVVLIRRASRLQILKLLRGVFDGSHLSMPGVEAARVRAFAIESAGPEGLNLDGEITGRTPLEVEVLPGALRVFA